MEKDMKTMWGAIWSLSHWNKLWRIQIWTMLLVGICMCARASELTQYCPTFENTSLPESEPQWDSDGVPKFITIALLDWKTRSKANKGKPYKMRLWRNYLDPRFCPVLWLMTWLHYSGIEQGPLFQKFEHSKPNGQNLAEDAWTNATRKLFTAAGLYVPGHKNEGQLEGQYEYVPPKGVTNHGIRRSACQWAGRCKANELDVALASRHRTYAELAKYMGQGAKMREQYEQDNMADPIFSTWVFKPVTVCSDSTRAEL